jgi:hypothetical protein
MSIRPSPLLGYNNNVRHKGKVFHIQTEDSGTKYGHITTHLFMDGGQILKSVKTSYAEYIDSERVTDIVREMMKQQHKAMFIALRDGKFDAVPDTPGEAATGDRPASLAGAPRSASDEASPAEEKRSPVPPLVARAAALSATWPAQEATTDARLDPRLAMRMPDEVALDVAVIERAADAASPTKHPSGDLPPPPATLLRDSRDRTPSPPPPAPSRTPPTPAATAGERRYAPTRPASIFGQARPQQGKSIFGADLMGDSSLDEVILSYLAEDPDDDDKQ